MVIIYNHFDGLLNSVVELSVQLSVIILGQRFKMAHSCQKKPNLRTNSLNKLLIMHRQLNTVRLSS
jgi:hypothetical protein